MNEEEKYIEIREKLRKLPRIQAREDFLNKLLNKINLLENQKVTILSSSKEMIGLQPEESISKKVSKKFSFQKPILNWLVPTVSFAILILVVLTYLLIIRNTDKNQETISSPQITQETEAAPPPVKEDLKLDRVQQETSKENLQLSEVRKEPEVNRQLTKEPAKVSNEAGVVAPIEKKDVDVKTETIPPLNGKNNDVKEQDEIKAKVKKDEIKTKGEDEKIGDKKGKVEASKTKDVVIPIPKKKFDVEKDGLIENKKKPQIEIKPDSIKK